MRLDTVEGQFGNSEIESTLYSQGPLHFGIPAQTKCSNLVKISLTTNFVAYCGTRVKILASSVQCCLIMWRKSQGTFRIRNSTMVLRQRGNVDVWVWTDTQQTGGNKQTEKTNRVTKYKKQLLFPIWWLDDFLRAAHIFVIYGASESQDAEVLLLLPHRQPSEARIPDLGFSEVSVVLP